MPTEYNNNDTILHRKNDLNFDKEEINEWINIDDQYRMFDQSTNVNDQIRGFKVQMMPLLKMDIVGRFLVVEFT